MTIEKRMRLREAGLVCQAWLEQGRITEDDYRDCELVQRKLRGFMQNDRQFGAQSSLFDPAPDRKAMDLDVGMLNNDMLQSLAEKLKDEGDTVFIRGNPNTSIRVRVFFTPRRREIERTREVSRRLLAHQRS